MCANSTSNQSRGNIDTESFRAGSVGSLLHRNKHRWKLPALPESDIALQDNVLISMFPALRSCGSIIHETGYHGVDEESDVRIGIDCCNVCARKHHERFRCKKCRSVVYCSAAHQAIDRGFHSTVCEALQVFESDANVDSTANLLSFIQSLHPSPLPEISSDTLDISMEELFREFVFKSNECTEWKLLHFFHGTPLGRKFVEHASFPLTLWSQWNRLPISSNLKVHVVGAARSECQFPALWTLLLPHGGKRQIQELLFIGKKVPKSLHNTIVHDSLRFYRGKYHHAITELEVESSPHVIFAPALGVTSNRYKWDETLEFMKHFLSPQTLIISTCYSEEEIEKEGKVLMERLHLRRLCQPFLNPFASTCIQQNVYLANDVFRSNYVISVFEKM